MTYEDVDPEELKEMFTSCSEVMDEMAGRDHDFFSDNLERWKRYGDRTHMSVAQMKWLRDIHTRYVLGTGSQKERAPSRRP